MLSRYQTGPVITVAFLLLFVLLFADGLHMALREHRSMGWWTSITALLALFNLHKRFYRSAD